MEAMSLKKSFIIIDNQTYIFKGKETNSSKS